MIIKSITTVNGRSGDLEVTWERNTFLATSITEIAAKGKKKNKMSFIDIYLIHVNK